MNAGVLFAYQSLYPRIESGIYWTNACPYLPVYAHAVCVQQETRAIARQFLPVHLFNGGFLRSPLWGAIVSIPEIPELPELPVLLECDRSTPIL